MLLLLLLLGFGLVWFIVGLLLDRALGASPSPHSSVPAAFDTELGGLHDALSSRLLALGFSEELTRFPHYCPLALVSLGNLNLILSHRIEELTCGGMVEQVQEAFGETMTSVVSLCARYPIACANSIGLLCTIPYTR